MTETRQIQITADPMIDCPFTIYRAWAPATWTGAASTLRHIDGKLHGRIGTDPDGSAYEDEPIGDKRTRLVDAAYAARYELAYAAIEAAFPAARSGKRCCGEIEVFHGTPGLDA
jgi:hypothetical protein